MGQVMMLGYSALLLAVLVGGAPFWVFRMATSGRYRAGLAGRLGRVPRALREGAKGREVVWVHAVSVGEVLAAQRLVGELGAALPGWTIVVSTTTEAGQRLARERFGEEVAFYMPLDLGVVVRRYLRVLRPRLLVLMESELWPRMLVECERAGVPVAVVNARVSDRSFPRYLRLRRWWRPLLAKVRVFLAQGEESARRLVTMGAPAERVRVSGNLKYDLQVRAAAERAGREAAMAALVSSRLEPGAVVVVCGSTLEGEERMLLEAWPQLLGAEPRAVMVLAPRHPDRFERVAGMVREGPFPVLRASAFAQAAEAIGLGTIGPGTIFLLDTIGDLAAMYGMAAIAFVGGSLVGAGGHNPLEPASFGVPVVIGSSFHNFREIVALMQAKDGIRIASRDQVAAMLAELLEDREGARALGRRGQDVFRSQTGATARTVEALLDIVRNGAPAQP